jgi:hypothetical protein
LHANKFKKKETVNAIIDHLNWRQNNLPPQLTQKSIEVLVTLRLYFRTLASYMSMEETRNTDPVLFSNP